MDLLWDRAIIMQKGVIRRTLTREELDRSGASLEELFFATTEGEAAQTEG